MLNIYDCNNYVRVRFEKDPTGLPLRRLFEEAYHSAPALYVFDGFDSKAMRRALYPEYKQGRTSAPDNFYIQLKFFQELLLHTGNVVICVPQVEADDVIATYCKAHPQEEIVIYSTDRDFCALQRPGLTTPMANLKGIEASDVRLYKTLVGDSSDNIPGIKGFGKGAWEKLTPEHKEELKNYFERKGEASTVFDTLTPMQLKNFNSQQSLLDVFWKIVGFYDISQDLIQTHMKCGVRDYALADAKLKESLQ